MSIEMMSSVFKSKALNSGEKIVLLALADRADDDGVCWPSVEGLRLKTGIGSYTTLEKHIWVLKDSGLISVRQRSDTMKGRMTNLYQINHSRLHTDEISHEIKLSREKYKSENPKITPVSKFLKNKGAEASRLHSGVTNTLSPSQEKIYDTAAEASFIAKKLDEESTNEN